MSQPCELLGLGRSSYYYEPATETAANLALVALIDRAYTAHPFRGSRGMRARLRREGHQVNRKRVQRLMRLMGLEAVYPKPHLSVGGTGHKVYPYLLRGVTIERADQVWSTDVTYIPMPNGFMYLTAVIDWYRRYVLSWRLSNTLDGAFCLEALEEALRRGCPEVFYGPGRAVHVGVVHRSAGVGGGQGEHGRQGSLPGQRLRGTLVADGDVRVRLPVATGGGAGVGDGVDDVLRVLRVRFIMHTSLFVGKIQGWLF